MALRGKSRDGVREGASSPRNAQIFPFRSCGADGFAACFQVWKPFRSRRSRESPSPVIARNTSPDIPFDRSLNACCGCEHGCIYCYARPSHNWLGLSSGLDFETRLFVKSAAPALLAAELRPPACRRQQVRPLAMGANTDPYQPVERRLLVVRGVLEVLRDCNHPVTITTKSAMVLRDLDILAPMAAKRLCAVANLTLLRLPHDVKVLFQDWLATHHPDRAAHVLSLLRQTREGNLDETRFGKRMQGGGPVAEILDRRFAVACRRLGFNQRRFGLRTDLFAPPSQPGDQFSLPL